MSTVILQTEEKRIYLPHKGFVPFCIAQYFPHSSNKIKDKTILPMRPLRIVIHIFYRLETHFFVLLECYLKSCKLGHSAHIRTCGISKKKWLKKSSTESRILAEEQHSLKSWAVCWKYDPTQFKLVKTFLVYYLYNCALQDSTLSTILWQPIICMIFWVI